MEEKNKMSRAINAVDLFCGAGGTSSGLYDACAILGRTMKLVAINHWIIAIETHSANHPDARHICANIEGLDPRSVVPGGHLDILVASPECTHHSVARGGKPVCDQLRASAWHILRWVELLRVDNILIENVREFRDWGPTDIAGKPIKSRKGETYRAFLAALRSLNYSVDDKVLNAADYGDPTTRRRLFIMARRGGLPIVWPKQTHGASNPYRCAREIIDWNIPGGSIFQRKRPLARKTMARIAAGLKKYGGKNAEPFLIMMYGTGSARSIDQPVPTVTATGQHIGLCQPFLIKYHGDHEGKADGLQRCHSLDLPLPTLDTSNRFGLVEPFLIHTNHSGGDRVHSVDRPLPTITCGHRGEMALIEPFVIGQQSCAAPRSVNEPLPTIATAGAIALVEPSVDELGVLDIRFRMLQPHELAAAMSFHEGYKFSGNKGDRVKQIGNAVPVKTAAALCRQLLDGIT